MNKQERNYPTRMHEVLDIVATLKAAGVEVE